MVNKMIGEFKLDNGKSYRVTELNNGWFALVGMISKGKYEAFLYNVLTRKEKDGISFNAKSLKGAEKFAKEVFVSSGQDLVANAKEIATKFKGLKDIVATDWTKKVSDCKRNIWVAKPSNSVTLEVTATGKKYGKEWVLYVIIGGKIVFSEVYCTTLKNIKENWYTLVTDRAKENKEVYSCIIKQ